MLFLPNTGADVVDRVTLGAVATVHHPRLGHGVLPQTDPANIERLVEHVHAFVP